MARIETRPVLTGILAGVTAALLVLGAVFQPSLSLTLYAASALPVLIVGLGWGNAASLAAVITAAAINGLVIAPQFALMMTAVTLGPAAWISHLASLARPASEIGGPSHLMAWYPLADILLHLCGLVTLGAVLTGYFIGYGPELVDRLIDAMMTSLQASGQTFKPDAVALAETRKAALSVLPASQSGLWVMIVFGAYYVATRIVAASGRNSRPREDMPSALRMSKRSLLIFTAGVLLTFVPGPIAWIGSALCGAFGAGFLLAGFATLHLWSRGKSWRVPGLVLAYLSTLFGIGALIMLAVGLSDTRRTIVLTPLKSDPSNTSL